MLTIFITKLIEKIISITELAIFAHRIHRIVQTC